MHTPMLVCRGRINDELELRERSAVNAFVFGYATKEHFDTLSDMQGVMLLAGCTSPERMWARTYCHDIVGPALQSIRDRYQKTGKFGCTGQEMAVLKGFVTRYRDFWLRQPMELYAASVEALQIALNERAAA